MEQREEKDEPKFLSTTDPKNVKKKNNIILLSNHMYSYKHHILYTC